MKNERTNLFYDNGNLSHWILDFDGNILNTQTPIYLKNKKTGEIELVESHYFDQHPELYSGENPTHDIGDFSFTEFRDVSPTHGHRGFAGLENDVYTAIKNGDFAPSFPIFKEAVLIKARLFSILTARWNSADNLQHAFQIITQEVLNAEEKKRQHENIIKNYRLKNISRDEALTYYLGRVANYIPCSNPHTQKNLGIEHIASTSALKAASIEPLLRISSRFLQQLYQTDDMQKILGDGHYSVGFSDDSVGNVVAVHNTFREILQKDDGIPKKMSVYFTGKKSDRKKLLKELWRKPWQKWVSEKDDSLKIKLKK